MTTQLVTRYCGRCGAPLPAGATFCGRCGTPAALQAAAVPPPMYRYPAAHPSTRQYRLGPALIAGGLIVLLIVVAVIVGGIAASQFAAGGHATCTSNCSPKLVAPLAEEGTYRSSSFKFVVSYSGAWTVRSSDANGVVLGTKLGSVTIVGTNVGNANTVLQQTVSGLPSSQFQDVTAVGPLRGAHLGNQDGVGMVYAANFVGSSQTATKVRFAVVAATHNGVTVSLFALGPADTKTYPNGMPEGQAIDYVCTEFVWGS